MSKSKKRNSAQNNQINTNSTNSTNNTNTHASNNRSQHPGSIENCEKFQHSYED